jgi:very-short-patch-repair endonuclease
MTLLYNKTDSLVFRRRLRRNQPDTERLVWSKLRNRQLFGYKFRRQYSVGSYIVDYCCPEAKLVIEIDGDSHYLGNVEREKDRKRQRYNEGLGFKFVRFTNKDARENIEGVLETIAKSLS